LSAIPKASRNIHSPVKKEEKGEGERSEPVEIKDLPKSIQRCHIPPEALVSQK